MKFRVKAGRRNDEDRIYGDAGVCRRFLRTLIQEGYEIAAVVTQPDRPVGRKRVLTPTPVKAEALQHGLTVWQPEKLRTSDTVDDIRALQPDLIVTAAYGQILPKAVLDIPRLGCINVHGSLLRNTGAVRRSSVRL